MVKNNLSGSPGQVKFQSGQAYVSSYVQRTSKQENAALLRSHIFDRIIISVPKYNYFGKPISITLNIILYEFIESIVYGHNIKL